jgi:hypothetical protein
MDLNFRLAEMQALYIHDELLRDAAAHCYSDSGVTVRFIGLVARTTRRLAGSVERWANGQAADVVSLTQRLESR